MDYGSVFDQLNFTYNDSDFELNPETQPCGSFSFPDAVMITLCVFYIFIFLVAVPGNLLVVLVLGSSQRALLPSDLYLLHLAVADLLLAITLPFWATSVIKGWLFGDALCKMITIIHQLSFYSSNLFLACISLDRYLLIVRALKERKANRQLLSWGVCVAVWVVGALLSLPGLFTSSFLPHNSNKMVCAEHFELGSADMWRVLTRILSHTLGFLVPLAIMLPCYGITMKQLVHVRSSFQRQRAMKVVVLVVAVFLLCWTPYHLAVIADTFFRTKVVPYQCPARKAVDKAMFATQSLALLHSCVNPVLYAFVGEKFRERLLQLVKKRKLNERMLVWRSSRSSLSSEFTSAFL